MVLSPGEANIDMCQASTNVLGKRDSDEEFKWEEFFGTSVDITSALLDMFDTIVAKNGDTNAVPSSSPSPVAAPLQRNDSSVQQSSTPTTGSYANSAPGLDPGGTDTPVCLPVKHPTNGSRSNSSSLGRRPPRSYSSKRGSNSSYLESTFQEKKRPLSTSSVESSSNSSSSSSSSSSLPRSDVKKSYLASIESLDDDEDDVDGASNILSKTDGPAVTMSSNGVSGGGSTLSSKPRWCDPNLNHTDRVLLEIVDTEKTYVRDLDEIIQGYLKHIISVKHPKVNQCLEELFGNIEDIYKFNSLFVEQLEQCGMNPVAVARCFVQNSTGFEVYTQYCTNYPRTVSVLTELMGNSETAEIFKERQMALQHNLPLGSYLLKPVQRILKYHLLLQNMVKYSDKESDGYIDIKNALSVMTGIAVHINDMKRKHEHAVRVQEIQSLLYGWEGQDLTTYGELVAEGAFRMYRAKALRHLFLFDRMLLIAKKKEEGILSYKTHIMCSNLMLIESIQGEPFCFHVIPFDNPRYQYTFQARNLEQKREWCLQLKRVILENYNAVIPTHARQLVMELGQSKQEDSVLEKSTTKRLLSAPEYLEKRKQERRKSEINLNRAFKLKKGIKKGELILSGKSFPSMRRKSASVGSHNEAYSRESWSSQIDCNDDFSSWTKSQDDVRQNDVHTNGYSSSESKHFSSSASYNLLNRDCRLRHSLPQPSLSHKSTTRERRFRPSWRAWNSVPEETTDTENEDLNDRNGFQRGIDLRCSLRQNYDSQNDDDICDNSGEYVTFFYAHSYATRDMPESSILPRLHEAITGVSPSKNWNDDDASSTTSNPSLSQANTKKFRAQNRSKKCASTQESNCNVNNTTQKDHDSESGSSSYSWKQSAAVRRVQSFTGMAKGKFALLHHNIAFKNHSSSCSEPKTSQNHLSELQNGVVPVLPANNYDISPTTPAAWLKLQAEHLASGEKKSGSLPRSFQLTSDSVDDSVVNYSAINSDENNTHRMRNRLEGQKCTYSEQRPFTIASDKPTQADFSDNMDRYVLECSPDADSDYCFLVRKDCYDPETTTGCTNTPAVSTENINSIHPELKIYHQAASKYTTLKHMFTSMGSKIAGLRAALANQLSPEQNDSHTDIEGFTRNNMARSSSRSSVRSENEFSHKIFTGKLAHSVAKAYSAVVKHKTKKHEFKHAKKLNLESKHEKSPIHTYKSESSLIGARMANPLESEYSVPANIISSEQIQKWKDDLRPDSLFSEYSNVTSSSDGDKESNIDLTSNSQYNKSNDADDTVSETSDTSADSYYERTFDAIENALAEDMFRDSAIYSDPEDADFSTIESMKLMPLEEPEAKEPSPPSFQNYQNGYTMVTPPKLGLLCKRPVNQAILERLKVLEENVRCQRAEVAAAVESKKTLLQKRLELEKWQYSPSPGHDCEESETSSEHSASTVNTVMESGISNLTEHTVAPRCPPRIKGWVKHVVDKLQGEG